MNGKRQREKRERQKKEKQVELEKWNKVTMTSLNLSRVDFSFEKH